jgi:hypothetical protein
MLKDCGDCTVKNVRLRQACLPKPHYQQTFIDTYTRGAFVKLYDRKNALVAAETLSDRVLPFFEEQAIPL